jgi:hypothetical protein
MAKDAKGHGSEARGGDGSHRTSSHVKQLERLGLANKGGVLPSPAHQSGVQAVNAFPQPGTQAWLDAKRGGPRWTWQDATGVQREGYMHTFSDRGGTDVSYFMHRDPGGQLDVVSGQRLKDAHTIPDHTVKK